MIAEVENVEEIPVFPGSQPAVRDLDLQIFQLLWPRRRRDDRLGRPADRDYCGDPRRDGDAGERLQVVGLSAAAAPSGAAIMRAASAVRTVKSMLSSTLPRLAGRCVGARSRAAASIYSALRSR
jgi:hypothetical protein